MTSTEPTKNSKNKKKALKDGQKKQKLITPVDEKLLKIESSLSINGGQSSPTIKKKKRKHAENVSAPNGMSELKKSKKKKHRLNGDASNGITNGVIPNGMTSGIPNGHALPSSVESKSTGKPKKLKKKKK